MITFTRASSGTALAKISYGANLNPAFFNYLIIGTGTWAASGSDYVFEDTVGSQVRPGVSWPTNTLPAGTYRAEIVVASITGATQVRVDGIGGDQLLGVGTHSFVFTTTTTSFVRIRIEDTSTTIGDGFAITSVSVRPVLYDQPDGTLQLFNHPANQPRVEYDAQGNRLGLLVEEARTNLLPYSEAFDNTAWIGTVTHVANEVGPDGLPNSAYTLTDQDTSLAGLTETISCANDTLARTFSVFIKKTTTASTFPGISIYYSGGTALNTGLTVNTNTGVVTARTGGGVASPDSFGVQEVGNYWRAHITVSNNASGNTSVAAIIYPSVNSDGDALWDEALLTSSCVAFGAQLEAGTFPTSYIPTSGATATRSADVASIGVGAFGYNKGAGTVLIAYELPDDTVVYLFELDDPASSANRWSIFRNGADLGISVARDGSNIHTSVVTNTLPSGKNIAAMSVDDTVVKGVSNGEAVTSTAGNFAVETGITQLTLGSFRGVDLWLNSHISSIAYYPRRLTDAQIKALTSPPETPTLSLTFDDSSTSYLETSIHG